MKRRRVIAGAVVLGLVAGAAVILWPRPPKLAGPRPDPATFWKVREGMTLGEIAQLVGAPAGRYQTRPVDFAEKETCGLVIPECWVTDDVSLVVFVDDDGRAFRVEVVPMIPATPEADSRSSFRRLRDWLGI